MLWPILAPTFLSSSFCFVSIVSDLISVGCCSGCKSNRKDDGLMIGGSIFVKFLSLPL